MDNKEKYNEEPVCFCSRCLSLRILRVPGLYDSYCDECGNTDIAETTIDLWEKLYKQKYNIKFLKKHF